MYKYCQEMTDLYHGVFPLPKKQPISEPFIHQNMLLTICLNYFSTILQESLTLLRMAQLVPIFNVEMCAPQTPVLTARVKISGHVTCVSVIDSGHRLTALRVSLILYFISTESPLCYKFLMRNSA